MNTLVPYLFFNGNCRDAMTFYKQCLGGELELFTYENAPEMPQHKNAKRNEIMHGSLKSNNLMLMASDWPGGEAKFGDNVHLNINCETKSQIETLFKKLSQDGKVIEPLADTFWGSHFGMLVDKFGIYWMLNYQLTK